MRCAALLCSALLQAQSPAACSLGARRNTHGRRAPDLMARHSWALVLALRRGGRALVSSTLQARGGAGADRLGFGLLLRVYFRHGVMMLPYPSASRKGQWRAGGGSARAGQTLPRPIASRWFRKTEYAALLRCCATHVTLSGSGPAGPAGPPGEAFVPAFGRTRIALNASRQTGSQPGRPGPAGSAPPHAARGGRVAKRSGVARRGRSARLHQAGRGRTRSSRSSRP